VNGRAGLLTAVAVCVLLLGATPGARADAILPAEPSPSTPSPSTSSAAASPAAESDDAAPTGTVALVAAGVVVVLVAAVAVVGLRRISGRRAGPEDGQAAGGASDGPGDEAGR
jgi:hypothetical protein